MRNHGAAGREDNATFVEEFLSEFQAATRDLGKKLERQKNRKPRRPKNFVVRGFAPQNDSRQSQAQGQPDNSKEVA